MKIQEGGEVPPGETRTIATRLQSRLTGPLASKLFGMRGYPGGLHPERGIDTAHVDQLLVFVGNPKEDYVFQIDNIRAAGRSSASRLLSMTEGKLFPMIDEYGQYIHESWPGKTHSLEDMARQRVQEEADLRGRPGPQGWNKYGGWAAGPKLEATGYFHPQKHQGKWWLVDPEGRLFWSHGMAVPHSPPCPTH